MVEIVTPCQFYVFLHACFFLVEKFSLKYFLRTFTENVFIFIFVFVISIFFLTFFLSFFLSIMHSLVVLENVRYSFYLINSPQTINSRLNINSLIK